MLEPPDLQDEHISACVQDAYGVRVVHVTFLPLGADLNTAVYRIVADDETSYVAFEFMFESNKQYKNCSD